MNNKQIGTSFEKDFCERLAACGWWVHFMTPTKGGSQPCDVIACKNGVPYLIDCKTCEDKVFRLSRLEDNQKLAFDRFIKTGNTNCWIAIKHNGDIYGVSYQVLSRLGKVELSEFTKWIFR